MGAGAFLISAMDPLSRNLGKIKCAHTFIHTSSLLPASFSPSLPSFLLSFFSPFHPSNIYNILTTWQVLGQRWTPHILGPIPLWGKQRNTIFEDKRKEIIASWSSAEIQPKKQVSSESIHPCRKATRRSCWLRICHIWLWHLCCCFLLKRRGLQTFFSLWLYVCLYESQRKKRERRTEERRGQERSSLVLCLLRRKKVFWWWLVTAKANGYKWTLFVVPIIDAID